MPVTYLDSSAIVKLAVREPESAELRRYLHHRRPRLSSASARTEVLRALLLAGGEAVSRGRAVLGRIDLVRVNHRVQDAVAILPETVRSLDAVHLATAQRFGADLGTVVTYDERMAAAARGLGLRVASPPPEPFVRELPLPAGFPLSGYSELTATGV